MRLDFVDEPSLPGKLSAALDALAVAAVLAMAAWLWPTDAMPPGIDLGHVPWWGSIRDVMLEGPDAGEWARNIRLVEQWQLDQLDHHRMPAWMLMVAAVMKLQPDVVLAGHVVNRSLYLLLGLSCFGLGRLRGGRMVGLLTAAMALALPHAMSASQRFGIDIAVTAMIPTVMLVALVATRWWWMALPAGLIAGLAAGLHYTTPPYLLPPLLLLLLQGRGLLPRLGGLLLFTAGAALSVRLLLEIYPVPSMAMFINDLASGLSPGGPGPGRAETVQAALAGVRADIIGHATVATASAVDVVRISGLPWGLMIALPWLGVVGLSLKPTRPGSGSWWKALLSRTDLALGLSLLVCLAPLPVLTGVGAPERYGNNLLPIVAVLVARGAGSLLSTADSLLRVAWAGWPRGPLMMLGLAPLTWAVLGARADARNMPPPMPQELGAMLLADALRELFPPGTGIASPIRESLVVADMSFCPQTVCPTQATEDHFERCVRLLAQQCAGDGPIGYVWTSATHFYDPNAKRAEMDAWVAERWDAVAQVEYADFAARVYLIDRPDVSPDEDPLQGLPAPGQAPDGSVPPPPDGSAPAPVGG